MEMKSTAKVMILLLLFGWLSGVAAAGERFTVNGDGTVTDHLLGLMWAETDNQGDIGWRDAAQYCRWGPLAVMGKYDNWRLPTTSELESLYVKEKDYPGYETACGQRVKVVPEIRLSCGWAWAAEHESITARVYNFQRGYHYMELMRHRRNYRALPVRNLQPDE